MNPGEGLSGRRKGGTYKVLYVRTHVRRQTDVASARSLLRPSPASVDSCISDAGADATLRDVREDAVRTVATLIVRRLPESLHLCSGAPATSVAAAAPKPRRSAASSRSLWPKSFSCVPKETHSKEVGRQTKQRKPCRSAKKRSKEVGRVAWKSRSRTLGSSRGQSRSRLAAPRP